MDNEWVVVLEVAGDSGDPGIELSALRDLLHAVADCRPAALHSPDRYALQLRVLAPGPAEALQNALHRWRGAVDELGLAAWKVASAEVLTAEEFTRQVHSEDAECCPPAPFSLSADESDDHPDGVLWRAFSDSLTNLASAGLFMTRVESAVVRARSTQTAVAVVVLDLDDFNVVNRDLGTEVGDAALVHVATLLGSTLRPCDTTARLENDQFGILLEDVETDDVKAVVRRTLDALGHKQVFGTHEVSLSACAGIALSGRTHTGAQLLNEAGQALAAAKDTGRAGWKLFGTEDSGQTSRFAYRPMPPDRAAFFSLLEHCARIAHECADSQQACQAMLQEVCAYTDWPLAHLVVLDNNGYGDLPSHIWTPATDSTFDAFRLARNSAPPNALLATGNPLAWGAPSLALKLRSATDARLHEAARAAGLTRAVAIPIHVGTEVVATVEFFGHQAVDSEHHILEVIKSVGTQLGRVLERRTAQAALSKADSRWRVLLQSSSETRTLIDSDGVILSMVTPTARAEPQPAWTTDEPVFDHVHPDDVVIVRDALARAIDESMPVESFDARLRDNSGEWQWFECAADDLLNDPLVGAIVIHTRALRSPQNGADATRGYRKTESNKWPGGSLFPGGSRLVYGG